MFNIKDFINNFDHSNPDWSDLPEDWPDCDTDGFTSAEIGQLNSIKGLWELSRPEKPKQRTREWTDPKGYKWLVQWSNTVLLRFLIRLLTDSLPKSEYRRKSQLDDAGRSVVRNIEEGFKRATTKEYIDFIGYSQGSLEEVKGDIRELAEDGFLRSRQGSGLADLGIVLGDLNQALKGNKGKLKETKGDLEENTGKVKDVKGELKDSRGNYRSVKEEGKKSWDYRPLTVLYPPLRDVSAKDLTYEMFIELINKTDYLLRKLVESLEKKMYNERKGYQVEQARIRDKFRKK